MAYSKRLEMPLLLSSARGSPENVVESLSLGVPPDNELERQFAGSERLGELEGVMRVRLGPSPSGKEVQAPSSS